MKGKLRHWWPALPACLILYLGAASFAEKYPQETERRAERSAQGNGPDSLLAYVHQAFNPARPPAADSNRDYENPFRPIHTPRPEGQGQAQAAKAQPPPRAYVLKGTVGNNVATITNNAGLKQIVKVGDPIDSAEVVSIETNKVILKDRAGKFELIFRK